MTPSMGMWIWNRDRCEQGDTKAIVAKALRYRLGHVLIKTNDGRDEYNGTLGPLVRAFKDASINVWAWAYVYDKHLEEQAEGFASRAAALNVNALSVDAEVEFKNHPAAATEYMTRLKAVAHAPVGVSSYYLPQNHPTFPWREFYSKADYAQPQVYWYSNNPKLALLRSIAQHQPYSIPIIPAGAAYQQATGDPGNIGVFLQTVREAGVGQVNFWSWEHATAMMWAEIEKFQKEAIEA